MDKLIPFNYDGHEVRTVILNGEPWFVAKDVCEVLELGTTSKAIERLDNDEKGVNSIPTPGGKQEMSIISESGLYSLVLGSKKPQAKPFKRWVTHDGYTSNTQKEKARQCVNTNEQMQWILIFSLFIIGKENDNVKCV